jgi:hypothetical protein
LPKLPEGQDSRQNHRLKAHFSHPLDHHRSRRLLVRWKTHSKRDPRAPIARIVASLPPLVLAKAAPVRRFGSTVSDGPRSMKLLPMAGGIKMVKGEGDDAYIHERPSRVPERTPVVLAEEGRRRGRNRTVRQRNNWQTFQSAAGRTSPIDNRINLARCCSLTQKVRLRPCWHATCAGRVSIQCLCGADCPFCAKSSPILIS